MSAAVGSAAALHWRDGVAGRVVIASGFHPMRWASLATRRNVATVEWLLLRAVSVSSPPMKFISSLLLLPLLLVPACGDKAANAAGNMVDQAKNAAGDVKAAAGDMVKQTAVVDKLKTTFGELTKSLSGITDGATAEKAKGGLESIVSTLKTQMGELGGLGKLDGMLATAKDGLMKGAMDQVTKLMGNADITAKIGPVLEQLKGLFTAK
jgi:hypothetical protein